MAQLDVPDPLAATLAGASRPGPVDAGEAPLEDTGFAERYVASGRIGAGGMGEVHAVRDRRIGREVALKIARGAAGSSGDGLSRFAREARVQGQLEHPAIVPVYDLGRQPDGAVFFTMKRVRGQTLADVLLEVGRGGEDVRRKYSRRRLLTAFASVGQAVDFAHSRGVLHRDLKPANVMLGDFGEVYVLDWGLAKLVGEAADVAPASPRSERLDASSLSGPATTSGSVLGTPGYMSPEQIRGEVEQLDARTDVYALGAVLFEILALEPLVPRGPMPGVLAATLAGVDARAGSRAPGQDVPPELEAVCVKATALDPAERYASVRELVEAVERYLDGDRDLERRKQLASEAAVVAEERMLEALASGGLEARKAALAAAGKALALDAENATALRVMMRLLVEPPRETPTEVVVELAELTQEQLRTASRNGTYAYVLWLVTAPVVLLLGVRDWTPVITFLVAAVLSILASLAGARARRLAMPLHMLALVVSSVAVAMTAPVFGPLGLPPILASINTIAYLLHSERGWRKYTFVIGMLSAVAPLWLDQLHVWPPMLSVGGDVLAVSAWAVHFPPLVTITVLSVILAGCVLAGGTFILHVRDRREEAEARLRLASWHLRQMVPREAHSALSVKLEEPAPLLSCPIDAMKKR